VLASIHKTHRFVLIEGRTRKGAFVYKRARPLVPWPAMLRPPYVLVLGFGRGEDTFLSLVASSGASEVLARGGCR
jgi:hypothetical protein